MIERFTAEQIGSSVDDLGSGRYQITLFMDSPEVFEDYLLSSDSSSTFWVSFSWLIYFVKRLSKERSLGQSSTSRGIHGQENLTLPKTLWERCVNLIPKKCCRNLVCFQFGTVFPKSYAYGKNKLWLLFAEHSWIQNANKAPNVSLAKTMNELCKRALG